MNAGATPIMFAAFAVVSTATCAAMIVLRDLFGKGNDDADSQRPVIEYAPAVQYDHPVDRRVATLLEEAGSSVGIGAAAGIILCSGAVAAAAALFALDSFLVAAAATVLGAFVPVLFWSWRRSRRLAHMRRTAPGALEMIADCVRSGRNLEQSLAATADDTEGPLAAELRYAASQLRLGHRPVAVMERLARRAPLAEFRIFTAAVLTHQSTGGALAILADRLASAAQDRLAFQEHLASTTSGSRFSAFGLIGGSLFGVVMLHFMRPEYQQTFFTHPWGPSVLAASAVLFGLGLAWMAAILHVRY